MGLFLECFYISSVGTFQIIYIALLGILFKHLKLVDKKFEDSLSKVIANLMLPSFIFCEVILNFDSSNWYLLIHILLGYLTVSFLGIIVGYIYAIIIGSDPNERKFFLAVLSSPNTTSITLILIEVLNPILETLKYNPLQDTTGNSLNKITVPTAKERGLLYISLLSIFSNIWRWAVTYNLIHKRDIDYIKEINQVQINKVKIIDSYQSEKEELLLPKNNGLTLVSDSKQDKSLREIFVEIINTPIVVSVLTLILSFSSFFKNLFTNDSSIFKVTLFNVHMTISKGYTFSVMFMLGLNIYNIFNEDDSTKKEKINMKIITGLAFIKMILMPLIGSPIIFYYQSHGFIEDPVLVFLMLFTLASPTAINILVICNVKKAWVHYMSLLMSVVYCFCIISITVSNAIFLYLLSTNSG
jgi:predicted permease